MVIEIRRAIPGRHTNEPVHDEEMLMKFDIQEIVKQFEAGQKNHVMRSAT